MYINYVFTLIGSLGNVKFGGNKTQIPENQPANPPASAPQNQFLNSSPQHIPRPQSYGGTANSTWQTQGNQPTAQPSKPDYNRSHFSSVFGERDGGKKGGGKYFLIYPSKKFSFNCFTLNFCIKI